MARTLLVVWMVTACSPGGRRADDTDAVIADAKAMATKTVHVELSKVHASYALTLPESYMVGGSPGDLEPGPQEFRGDACKDTLCETTWHTGTLGRPNFAIQVRYGQPKPDKDWSCTPDGKDCTKLTLDPGLMTTGFHRSIAIEDHSVICIADLHGSTSPAAQAYLKAVCATLVLTPMAP